MGDASTGVGELVLEKGDGVRAEKREGDETEVRRLRVSASRPKST